MLLWLLQGVNYSSVSGTSAWQWALIMLKAPQKNHRSQDAEDCKLRSRKHSLHFPVITFCNSPGHSPWYCLPLHTLPSASSVFYTTTALKFFFQAAVRDKCKIVTTSTVFDLTGLSALPKSSAKLEGATKQKKTIMLQRNDWLLYDVVATTHILPWDKVLACWKRRVAGWAYLWISCRLTAFIKEDHIDPLLHQTLICRQACQFFLLKLLICGGNQASKFSSLSLQILFFIIPKLLFQYPYYSSILIIPVLSHITLQELVLKHSVASRFLADIMWYLLRVETFTDTIWCISTWWRSEKGIHWHLFET